MRRRIAAFALTALLPVFFSASSLFSREEEGAEAPLSPIADINSAENRESALQRSEKAINECQSYDDYEKLASEIKRQILRQPNSEYSDILHYMCAKNRIEELSYLTKKNDIDAGRIYMSVSEKYYNDALACLDKASRAAKSRDLDLNICFLRFLIFKEMFRTEDADAIFSEMVNGIASYTRDASGNISKLNEISQLFSDKALGDYAIKLKLLYASKVDPDSAKRIADDIRMSADKYFDEGRIKEALTTYDTYLQLAENYYGKDAMAAKLMDIAEKFFNKARYREAVKYYSMYLFKYGDSQVADYCGYKLGISLYHNKEYPRAIEKLEEFLNTYQNSVWFEKAFESLCKLYYENLNIEQSIDALQKIVDKYPRRDSRDYAYLLLGALHYGNADYDKAISVFKKIETDFPRSVYLYAAGSLIQDIEDISKGAVASYSFGSKDLYKIWEPYMCINGDIGAGEGAQIIENKGANTGELFVQMAPGAKATFNIMGLEDMDRFNEYAQDKDDQSRLPRKIRDATEKDLLFFSWSAEAGKFTDDKQAISRTWQAPNDPGNYTITINIGDLGLVRPPDTGSRKDPAKNLTIHISVEK